MGTEVGHLGGYGFQGAIFGVDGWCKNGKIGSGCCKFQGEEADKCARVGRKEEGTSSNRPELGGVVLMSYSQQPLVKMSYYCAIMQRFVCYQEVGRTSRKEIASYRTRC
jgi:hypothetical protein